MLKTMTWSLLSGGVLAAGFAYVYSRRARLRRQSERPSAPSASEGAEQHTPSELGLDIDFENDLLQSRSFSASESDEFEVEIVDIDSLSEEEEGYDATSPEELGATWLSRATQTSGVRASATMDEASIDDGDFDPAGRPTELPEEPPTPAVKRLHGVD